MEPELENRQVTLALLPEVWEILDGTNKLAQKEGDQTFEKWLSQMVTDSVMQCLKLAMAARSSRPNVLSVSSREGNV